MNIEFSKKVLSDIISIIYLLTGIFLVVTSIINPGKLIVRNLPESNYKDKNRYVASMRVLLMIIGLIFTAIVLLLWFNIIGKSDSIVLSAISVLIMEIGNSIISKKYLINIRAKNKDEKE